MNIALVGDGRADTGRHLNRAGVDQTLIKIGFGTTNKHLSDKRNKV